MPADGFDGQKDANFRHYSGVGEADSKDNRKRLVDAVARASKPLILLRSSSLKIRVPTMN
jgi:hypothetical protein